jgi:tyrosyl-DNA phosphodiesterase-1
MHRETLQRLRMVWPTAAFVRDSVYGWGGGGAICGNSKNFVTNANLKARLFKYAPQMPERRNLTPHLKSYAVYDAEHRPVDDPLPLQYYLMTSANVSRGAWGDLQKDAEQFQIGNYEMGVLFLPEAGRSVHGAQVGAESAAAIDVPLIVNPLKLEPIRFEMTAERANEDEWPWAWDMQFSGLDRTGSVNTPRDSSEQRFPTANRPPQQRDEHAQRAGGDSGGGGGRGGRGRGRGRGRRGWH